MYKFFYFITWLFLIPFFIFEKLPFSEYSTYTSISQVLSLIPGKIGILIRRVWYKNTLKKCGKNLTVDWLGVIRTKSVEIGNSVTIGVYSWISHAVFGDNVITGSHVVIISGAHQHSFKDKNTPIIHQKGKKKKIIIDSDVWIGSSSIIMTDISFGNVVGAGSVVTKKYPVFSVIAGNPAKIINRR